MGLSKCLCAIRAVDFRDRIELDVAHLQVGRGGRGLSCQVPQLMIAQDNNSIFLVS